MVGAGWNTDMLKFGIKVWGSVRLPSLDSQLEELTEVCRF